MPMKYICFYDDGQYYYCYADDGKFYKGKDAETFKPGLKYYLAIVLTTVFGEIFANFLKDELSAVLCIVLTLICATFSIVVGLLTYRKIIREADKKLCEIHLSNKQFAEYVVLGKKRFSVQLFLLYALHIIAIFSFIFFCLSRSPFCLLAGIVLSYLSALLSSWVNPFKKFRFYKKFAETHT